MGSLNSSRLSFYDRLSTTSFSRRQVRLSEHQIVALLSKVARELIIFLSTARMDGQRKKQWGVTSAISEAPPKPEEAKLNDELVATLNRKDVFETTEGNKKRYIMAQRHHE